jgi:acyl-coenzyme A synthetase/AMP-(fatty) acid ligase
VQLRGHRIELGEIEAVMRHLPDVTDAGVIIAPNDRSEPVLEAFYVPANGDDNKPSLRAALLDRLPRHMLPARLLPIAELPVTPEGKLDRRRCLEL